MCDCLLTGQQVAHFSQSRANLIQSAHSEQVPLSQQATMTDSGPKFKIFKFLKIMFSSFVITVLLLFTIASIRTLSLDVNHQLAHWEKTNNISLVIDRHQREELLTHFKGNFRLVVVKLKLAEIIVEKSPMIYRLFVNY